MSICDDVGNLKTQLVPHLGIEGHDESEANVWIALTSSRCGTCINSFRQVPLSAEARWYAWRGMEVEVRRVRR